MRAFLNDHQNTIAAIGATTSVGASAASFFSAVNPILQFVSLVIGITVGALTIIHLLGRK
jgi:hypothetical protein